jgi:uncharacterized membrane protein YdcZ (DUF606 family)
METFTRIIVCALAVLGIICFMTGCRHTPPQQVKDPTCIGAIITATSDDGFQWICVEWSK